MVRKNRLKRWLGKYWFSFVILVFVVSLAYVAHGFVIASAGEYSPYFEPSVWGHYGSFLGAILLAATIIFQVISFKRQQIENKFFELVKYYRDNIQEMQLRNPFYYVDKSDKDEREKEKKKGDEKITGRRVMKIIFDQYSVACRIVYDTLGKNSHSRILKESSSLSYNRYFDKIKNCSNIDKDRFIINELAYMITFWGVPMRATQELEGFINKYYDIEKSKPEGTMNILVNKVIRYPALYDANNPANISSYFRKEFSLKEDPQKTYGLHYEDSSSTHFKFFGGYQYQLGHFFRHLFQAIKYIDEQPWWLLDFDKKRDYIKTLRAQMSNYEQALLLINSLSTVGREWEYAQETDDKKLISKYDIVKNIPKFFIPDMIPDKYYPEVDFEYLDGEELKYKSTKSDFNFRLKMAWDCWKNSKKNVESKSNKV